MKDFYTNIKKFTGLAALSVLMAAGLVSCDITGLTDTLDEFGVVVELEPINTNSTVLLYDAVSGELITNNVTITYSGDNGDNVIDSYSDPISSSTVSDGILGFGISNSVTPSADSPAEIQLILEANGYISKSTTISLTSIGQNEFEVEMVRENNKPEGVETATSTEGQADATTGAVQQDFSVTSNAEGDDESGTSIEVESGTTFKDANGNNLTGQLTSSVTYYNPNELSALKSIPVEATDDEGNLIEVMGGTAVTIQDSNGNIASTGEVTAKSSSNHGLTYVFKIPSSTINNSTDQTFRVNDSVSGAYIGQDFNKVYFTGTIVDLGNGAIGVRYTSNSVPRFAYVYQRVSSLQTCTITPQVSRTGNSGSLYIDIFRPGFSLGVSVKAGTNETNLKNYYIPRKEVDITVRTTSATYSFTNVSLCENSTITLPAPAANTIDAQINVSLECSNGGNISTTDLPATSVLYRKTGAASGTKWNTASNVQFQTNTKGTALQGGRFDVQGVEQGSDYDFKVNFDGDTYNQIIEITGTTTNSTYTINNNDVCTTN